MAKVDLITGFLGSGKTTFIKKYARYLMDRGEKIGIIENDYGAISVDLLLLNEELGEDCCLEMVVAGDMDCYRRRFKTKLISMGMLGLDRVIVEPSGIYDVDEFFDILYEEPLDRWYQIGNVIAIVDASLEEKMSEESDYLLVSQISGAGKVIFSKSEDASEEDLARTVEHMNRALSQYRSDRQFQIENILAKPWDNFTETDWSRIQSSGYVGSSHIKKMVSEENSYQSLFYYHAVMEENNLRKMAGELLSDAAYGHVYRVKGFVTAPSGQWYQVNATADKMNFMECGPGQEVLMVIGEMLERQKIDELVKGYSNRKDITAGQTAHHHAHH